MADPERPLLLHISAQACTPRAHPAIHRQLIGLAPDFRQRVLETGRYGYVVDALTPAEQAQHRALGLEVIPEDTRTLQEPASVAGLAASIACDRGPVHAIVGQLGHSGWRAIPLAAALDCPIFTLFYGSDGAVDMSLPTWRPHFERLARAPGAWFGGVSASVVEEVVAWGLPAQRSFVQYSGIDLASFPEPEPGPRDGPLRVALVGRLVEFKGHRTALAAFARLLRAQPGSTLHLYGDGPLQTALRSQADAAGIADQVHWHGIVPIERLRQELGRTHVAIQPSIRDAEGRREGLPNTLLEAMALGLPVVGTRHAGIPEAVVHEDTGLLIEEGDAEGLARALQRLAKDRALAARLGAGGRRRIRQHFDSGACAAALGRRLHAMRRAYDAIPSRERARAWAAILATNSTAPARRHRWSRLSRRLRAILPGS